MTEHTTVHTPTSLSFPPLLLLLLAGLLLLLRPLRPLLEGCQATACARASLKRRRKAAPTKAGLLCLPLQLPLPLPLPLSRLVTKQAQLGRCQWACLRPASAASASVVLALVLALVLVLVLVLVTSPRPDPRVPSPVPRSHAGPCLPRCAPG